MQRCLWLIGFLLSVNLSAQEIQRGTITSCAYQAGTALEIQKIRQSEGDNWASFEAKIKQIYEESQGRTDLLIIAERVFVEPAEKTADDIHEQIFNACVQRQQGTEPIT